MRSSILACLCAAGFLGCAEAPVIRAAKEGSVPGVQAALAAGPIDQRSLQQAMCRAATAGNVEILKALLAKGALINEEPSTYDGPQAFATRRLCPCADGDSKGDATYQTPLMCAAKFGRTEAVQFLLAAGADVDAHNGFQVSACEGAYGYTALSWAAAGGHEEAVKALLAHHADTTISILGFGCNSKKRRAPDLAREGGHESLAKLIEAAGPADAGDEPEKHAKGSKSAPMASEANAAGLAVAVGAVGAMVPGSSAVNRTSGLRQGVQAGLDAAHSAKAAADAAERAEGLKIRVPESFATKKVAVLPLNNMTNDLQGPLLFRQLMQSQLAMAGFRSEGTEFLDRQLKGLGITDGGQLPSKKPDELGKALDSDDLLYGELVTFKDQNLGVYATRTVEAHAWLVDAKTGRTVWDATKKKSNPKVAVTGAAVRTEVVAGYAGTVLEKAMGSPLRPETEDVVRMLVKDMASRLDQPQSQEPRKP